MNEVKLNTIRALIGEATPKIGRFEAMILLAHILGKPKEYLIAHDDEELPDTTLMTFDVYVSMRLDGVPVAYLTGRQEFFGRYFTVDHNVLIPRPDTEVLIEQALIVAPEKPEILDMGTGSGCIAVTLAKECPGARVTATDVSEEALAIARGNAEALGAEVEFRKGSWWEAVPEGARYDLIVSNPPYIPQAQLDALQREVRDFEPRMALDGGADGLDFYRRIAQGAPAFLAPWGTLLLEVGAGQADAVAALLAPHFAHVRAYRDMQGVARMLEATNQAEDEHVAG